LDFNTSWDRQLVNRWRVAPIGSDPFTDETQSGTPWPSVGEASIQEVSTPHGSGFKFLSTAEQLVGSGGKKTEVHDNTHTRGMGFTDEFSGKFMFPAAGNPDGFPRNFPSWNVFWDHHGSGRVPFFMGIDTTEVPYRNTIYVESVAGGNVRKAHAPAELVYDRWYSFRYQIKWSSGSDGFVKWYLDGQLLADWTGPTIDAGDNVNLQFGFYSTADKQNEVWLADIRKA